ncbi:MAG TPA: hypothetical protein VD970_15145 [Acetobacteraceae bacterium]|nr:hypothetical protein [Acetobacteraceae bacterium]
MSHLFGRRRSQDPREFGTFLARQSAFIAQKTVYDYCRVKAGRDEVRLFNDPDFKAALNHCRWQVYFSALSDVAALAEAWLRPAVQGREEALRSALVAWHEATLADQAVPPDEREAAEAARLALPGHLAGLQLDPPYPAHRLPLQAEAPLLATLPVHEDQRRGEGPAIRGALRFHIVSAQQDMERSFDREALARALTAG